MKRKHYFILLLVILGLGLFLRIYDISSIPPGIYPDEAANGEDALKAFRDGGWKWFYTSNQGREGLFMNLIALCFQFFGVSIFSLKLPSVLFGTLTVLGTYLLANEIFRLSWPDEARKKMALIASFLVATSFWAINFSRIAFRAIMLPAILSFSFYFLWKGLRTRRYLDFFLGGIIFGIGVHTYIAFRIAPAILVITLISLILSRPSFLRNYWKSILVFVAGALISAAPMLYTFFYAHPEYLESRSSSISVFSPEVNNGRPIQTLFRSFSLSLIKYNFVGDMNWRHNYRPYPLIDPVPGIAFLFGALYSGYVLFGMFKKRLLEKIKHPEMDVYVFLLSWFFFMLVPEFMTAEGNPHALRSIGTLPVVFIFAAIGFGYLLNSTAKNNFHERRLTAIILTVLLVFSGILNSIKYLGFWAEKPIVGKSFNHELTLISEYLKNIPDTKKIYVITGYNTLERLPIYIFHSEKPNIEYLYPNQADQIQPGNSPFEVILTGKHEEAIEKLQSLYPDQKLGIIQDPLESVYYIFK